MLFSSNIFIFLFLPLYLLIYYLTSLFLKNVHWDGSFKQKILNSILFILSLFFYYWCSGKFIIVFLFSICLNTFLGRIIASSKFPRLMILLGVSFNLIILGYYKYFGFICDQVFRLVNKISGSQYALDNTIFLPVGISFYTFMAISYLVEIYRKKEKAAGILSFGTYLSLFPHLVAGPIVRYSEIDKEIESRTVTAELFNLGIWRFCVGLGKKVILANSLGAVSDKIFSLPQNELTTAVSWVGIICYTLQIFFDFSGYSDMAIGLARFFGFHFPENFNQPYNAKNITEFWRKWHMTLSRWFRDFLYIPLGGNRESALKTYRNLVVVFFLCGLWHGASWTFVIWGLYHGLLLVIERILKKNFSFEMKGVSGLILTLVLVMIGWVFFRSPNIDSAIIYLKTMFGFSSASGFQYFSVFYYLNYSVIFLLITGLFISTVPPDFLKTRYERMSDDKRILIKGLLSILLLTVSVMFLSKTEFNPFIYFQF